MNDMNDSPLYKMMHPKSVAFWGASKDPTGMGSFQLAQLLALGFEGAVYPIHPRDKKVNGLPAYASIKDVPGPVDLAVFVLPTRVVPEILEECGQAGIKRIIITSAGFGEMGSEGKDVQDRLVEIARRHGIYFLGPNCIGVVNSYTKLNTTFFPYEISPGFVGMASQSGSFVTQMFSYLGKFGLGFSQAVSVGNEAMLDLTDCIEYLGFCSDTKVIALYVEGIRRGREFVRVAREVSKKKPIVAYYVGGSEAGGKAGKSHTGALAGPDLLYDGIFEQCGIVRASSAEELFDMCFVLGTQPLPKGDRVAVLTHSGGPGAAAADTVDRTGLKLANLSAETLEQLADLLPHTGRMSNPVDLTFNRNPRDYVESIPSVLLQDKGVDSLFIYLLMPAHRIAQVLESTGETRERAAEMAMEFVRTQADLAAMLAPKFGKPVVGGSFVTREESYTRELQDRGVPMLPSPERAIRALAALHRYARARAALLASERL
jgi:acetate---CoA ligase (ADP-forming) subunit alpha